MWHRLIVCGGILAMGAVGVGLQTSSSAAALPGCCKERKTVNGQWKITKLSQTDCMERNKSEGDNLVRPTGLIWWDIAC